MPKNNKRIRTESLNIEENNGLNSMSYDDAKIIQDLLEFENALPNELNYEIENNNGNICRQDSIIYDGSPTQTESFDKAPILPLATNDIIIDDYYFLNKPLPVNTSNHQLTRNDNNSNPMFQLYQAQSNQQQQQQFVVNKLKLNRNLLELIVHAFKCVPSIGETVKCTNRNCIGMKAILKHMAECNNLGSNCDYKHCSLVYQLIQHYNNCLNSDCPLCKQVNEQKPVDNDMLNQIKPEAQQAQQAFNTRNLCESILKLIEYHSYTNELCRMKLQYLQSMLVENLNKPPSFTQQDATRLDALKQNENSVVLYNFLNDLIKNLEDGKSSLISSMESLKTYKNEIDLKFQSITKLKQHITRNHKKDTVQNNFGMLKDEVKEEFNPLIQLLQQPIKAQFHANQMGSNIIPEIKTATSVEYLKQIPQFGKHIDLNNNPESYHQSDIGNAQQQQQPPRDIYTYGLDHALSCLSNSCGFDKCFQFKSILKHLKTCETNRTHSNCGKCEKLMALCIHHAKQCVSDGSACKIPFCAVLKTRLQFNNNQQQQNQAAKSNANFRLSGNFELPSTLNATNNIKLTQNTTNNNSNNNISLNNFIVFQTKNPMANADDDDECGKF